jgi:excisionase family DNA binding protein
MLIPWRERLNVKPGEAAQILGLSVREVRRMIDSGELEVDRRGRAVRVRVASLLAREAQEPAPPPRPRRRLSAESEAFARRVAGERS